MSSVTLPGGGGKDRWFPFIREAGTAAFGSAPGDFSSCVVDAGGTCRMGFTVPDDFSALDTLTLEMIPDATETIQYDLAADYAAIGQAYTTHTGALTNKTESATLSQLLASDISAAFASLAAEDRVGIVITSDTSDIRILGIRLKYT